MRHRLLAGTLALAMTGVAAADWQAGVDALQRGDYATAEAEFRAAVAANPTYAGAHFNLGETLRRMDRSDEALASLESALRLDPYNPLYQLVHAQTLLAARRPGEAAVELRSMDPAAVDPGQRRSRAVLLARAELPETECPEELVGDLEIALAGQDDAVLERFLGLAQVKLEHRELAFLALARAFELEPKDTASATDAIGLAAELAGVMDGERRRAELYAEVARIGEQARELLLPARLLREAGQLGRAAALLDKALAASPDDPAILYLSGWTLRCQDRTEEAMKRFRAALEHGPDTDLAKRVYGQMARIAERKLKVEEAARYHELAGDHTRAERMLEIQASVDASLERLATLRRQIAEIRAKITDLERLGQTAAVAKVEERLAPLEQEAAAIDGNLAEVRQALQQRGAGCG